jgi:hypothetical protein
MSDEAEVVAWFDPGLTTGAAAYDVARDRFTSRQLTKDELAAYIEALHAAHGDRLAVGYELYVQTPRPRPGSKARYSNEAIAAIEAACATYGIPVLKGQPSSARMVKSTVVFLRRLGWYRQGQQHANDAACHLFRHLVRRRPVPENIRRGLPSGY